MEKQTEMARSDSSPANTTGVRVYGFFTGLLRFVIHSTVKVFMSKYTSVFFFLYFRNAHLKWLTFEIVNFPKDRRHIETFCSLHRYMYDLKHSSKDEPLSGLQQRDVSSSCRESNPGPWPDNVQ